MKAPPPWGVMALWQMRGAYAKAPPPSTPAPPAAPTPAPPTQWKCSVCLHVYAPKDDGGGKDFEDLPDT
eukprot:gene7383-21640_t